MSEPGAPQPTDLRRAAGSIVVASVAVAAVAVVVILVVVTAAPIVFAALAEALGPGDGNRIARSNVEQAVAIRVESLGYWHEPTDAETLAAERLSGAHGGAEFTPVAWAGRVAPAQVATVDVRVSSRVAAHSPATFGERGTTAGSAVACYRFTFPSTDFVGAEQIDCVPGVTPGAAPTPTPTRSPRLPDDATERIVAALESEPRSGWEHTLRNAFPGPGVTIETATTDDGERVVAVGTPGGPDCRLLVQRTDGSIVEPGFDPAWVLPGEVGCSTALFTAPPR